MNKILIKIIVIIVLVIQNSCDSIGDPKRSDEILHVDSTKVWINDGIYMTYEGLQDIYTLDDTLNFKMRLFNQDNPDELYIHIGNSPPFTRFYVYNENNLMVYEYPTIYGCMEFNDTLFVGDSLIDRLEWTQISNLSEYDYEEPKVFSGYYKIKGNFRGNDSLVSKHLIKWIKINEEGDSFYPFIYRNFEPQDSLITSFIICNRTSKNITLTLSQNNPLNIYYVANKLPQDTVLSFQINNIPSMPNEIDFLSHSDKLIYDYRIAENDSLLVGLWGAYHLIFELNCQERTFIASKIITLYN